MTVTVLLFGPAAAAAHADKVTVDVRDGATVADVLAALGERHPALRPALAAARLAVNHAFGRPEQPVRPTDEVALIALVGGG